MRSSETKKTGRPRGLQVRGDLLRQRREALHLTRADLSDLVGLTTKSIQKAEQGGPVSAGTLRTLCEALSLRPPAVMLPCPTALQARLAERGRAAPQPPSCFVGREEEEARLVRLLLEAAAPVCIAGPAGSGKSALARRVLAEVMAQFPEAAAWIKASHAGAELSVQAAQADLAAAIPFPTALPSPDCADPAAITQAFLHQLWAGPKLLLVVDEALSEAFARALAPPGSPVRAIVTTPFRHVAERYAPRVVRLDGLPSAAAPAILATYVGEERLAADPEGVERLALLVGGSPRALHVAGAVLRREVFTTPSALADRWTKPAVAPALAGLLDDMFRTLSPPARALLQRLAPQGERPFTPEAAAALAGLPEPEVLRLLGELHDAHLLRSDGGNGTRTAALEGGVASLVGEFVRGPGGATHQAGTSPQQRNVTTS